MADPLSATGSAIAVIGLAVQTCEVLCSFFRSLHDASEDLKHHVATLQALKYTFTGISDLYKDLIDQSWVRKALSSRLRDCFFEMKEMENFVRPLHDGLESGRTRRVWTTTKWVGCQQKQRIERFMTRIESYYMTFSLDLILINT